VIDGGLCGSGSSSYGRFGGIDGKSGAAREGNERKGVAWFSETTREIPAYPPNRLPRCSSVYAPTPLVYRVRHRNSSTSTLLEKGRQDESSE
jgi:hypothetical protein